MKKIYPILLALMFCFVACSNDRSGNPLTDEEDPAKPTELKTELQQNAVLLSWKKDANSSTYQIFRSPTTQKDGIIGTTDTTQFQDTAVVDEKTYEYWVRGVGPGDERGPGILGTKSNPKSVTYYAPQLVLVGNPNQTLDFGDDRMTLDLTFKNKGGGLIQWEIPDEIPWAKFTPSKGSVGGEPFSVTAEVDRELSVNAYEEATTLKGNLGDPIDLIIRMEISDEPVLVVELSQPEKEKVELCPGEEDDIKVGNAGKGTLVWQISGGADWLKLTPLDGTIEGGQSVLVHLQALELDVQTGNESVALQVFGGPGDNPNSQEKSVIVTLRVVEPEVEISPNPVALTESDNWESEITLTNTCACSLSWEATSIRTWLIVDEPKTGLLRSGEQEKIWFHGVPDPLDTGEHNAQIRFTLNGKQNEFLDVTLSRTGYLQGRVVNIFTRQGIPEVTVTTDVGNGITNHLGDFEIVYEQERSYGWTATHPDFLQSEGTVLTSKAIGEIGTVSLIPIPQIAGEVISNFGYDTPWSIVLSDDERQACGVNRDGGFVSIIDTNLNKELGTIEVGGMPLSAVYIAGELFVANSWDNTVSIIDPLQRKSIATVDVYKIWR